MPEHQPKNTPGPDTFESPPLHVSSHATQLVRRALWHRAAVATWTAAGVWSAVFGVMATGLGCVSVLPASDLRPFFAGSGMPRDQVDMALSALPAFAGCMGVAAVVPGVVLLALGWSVEQGRHGAIASALTITALLAAVALIFTASTLLPAPASATVPQSLANTALGLLLWGGLLALFLNALQHLKAAYRAPANAPWDPDDDPWDAVL